MAEQTATEIAEKAREILGWDGDMVIEVARTDRATSHLLIVPLDAVEGYGKTEDRITTRLVRWHIDVWDRDEMERLMQSEYFDDPEAMLAKLARQKDAMLAWMVELATRRVTQ